MKVALITAPPEEAELLARRLVEAGLAACVNVLPGVTSIYRWQGKVHADGESLLVAKVSDENAEAFAARAVEWHSYDCPECILLPIAGGNPDYLAWVNDPSAGA